MTYEFSGFFARSEIQKPIELQNDSVWREIKSPFVGVGVLLNNLTSETPSVQEVKQLAEKLGFENSGEWIYLTYNCWGGQIDFVYGMYSTHGNLTKILEESDLTKVESAYTDLMACLGVSVEDALNFTPFERGFWGEI